MSGLEGIADQFRQHPVVQRIEALPQRQKAKFSLLIAGLCFFMFALVMIVFKGTTVKQATARKQAAVVFMEVLPDDLLGLRYLLTRPDVTVAAIVVSGSGMPQSARAAADNLERFLTRMASEGSRAAATVPVYYGTSFATSAATRTSKAALVAATLPPSPVAPVAGYLANWSAVVNGPRDPLSCSMTSRLVDDDVLRRADTLFGAAPLLPPRQGGVRGFTQRPVGVRGQPTAAAVAAALRPFGDPPSSKVPFYVPLARDVLAPLMAAGVPLRAVCFGPTTDLVILLRRAYDSQQPVPSAGTQMPRLPQLRVFSDLVVAGGSFGAGAEGDVQTYVTSTISTTGPLNAHAEQNFFFDAASAKLLIEGGDGLGDDFAAKMAPVLTLISLNAAKSASYSQDAWAATVDAKASQDAPTATSTGIALRGLSNLRRTSAQMPPMYKFDLTAPLDLLTAVYFTDAGAITDRRVLDRVSIEASNQIPSEGVTGKGSRSTSPGRAVLLSVKSGRLWTIANQYLFGMPYPSTP